MKQHDEILNTFKGSSSNNLAQQRSDIAKSEIKYLCIQLSRCPSMPNTTL